MNAWIVKVDGNCIYTFLLSGKKNVMVINCLENHYFR